MLFICIKFESSQVILNDFYEVRKKKKESPSPLKIKKTP